MVGKEASHVVQVKTFIVTHSHLTAIKGTAFNIDENSRAFAAESGS